MIISTSVQKCIFKEWGEGVYSYAETKLTAEIHQKENIGLVHIYYSGKPKEVIVLAEEPSSSYY